VKKGQGIYGFIFSLSYRKQGDLEVFAQVELLPDTQVPDVFRPNSSFTSS